MLSLMLLMAMQDGDTVARAMEKYRTELSEISVRCRVADAQDEIVVCARRDADRWRVPYVPAGSKTSVPARTAYLTQDFGAVECGKGPFMVNCGKVGVSVTQTFGAGAGSGDVRVHTERELAP